MRRSVIAENGEAVQLIAKFEHDGQCLVAVINCVAEKPRVGSAGLQSRPRHGDAYFKILSKIGASA